MVLYLVKFSDHISAKLAAIETISCLQVSHFYILQLSPKAFVSATCQSSA